MAISKRLRYEVLRRDGFKCRYCGTTREYVLQAAQLAGTELNYTIDRYLPEKSEVPF